MVMQKKFKHVQMKGQGSLVSNLLGVFVAVLIGVQLLPVIQDTIHDSTINETQRTTIDVVPILFAVAILVAIAAAIVV